MTTHWNSSKRKLEDMNKEPSTAEAELAQKAKEEQLEKARTLLNEQQALWDRAQVLLSEDLTQDPEMVALLVAITGATNTASGDSRTQDNMVKQLKLALGYKDLSSTGDWQKDLLRQFSTNSNKVTTAGGVTTLKPDILKRLSGEEGEFNMADWLSRLNRQDIGESICEGEQEGGCKHGKLKSGILEKATMNIMHKETWPQKSLMEDWADEDIEFRQMQFEHHVAGEVCTIETCTQPAEILGLLKLLRRMAYAKLRGYDWTAVRKMYAAILRSIEVREYSWEFNFGGFEGILFKRPPQCRGRTEGERIKDNNQKKWFSRDWNKPEGCNKTSPHKAWFGSGSSAISRTVIHMCVACYIHEGQGTKGPPRGP